MAGATSMACCISISCNAFVESCGAVSLLGRGRGCLGGVSSACKTMVYPLVNEHSNGKIHHFSWENPLISMAIFNCYVSSPEGKSRNMMENPLGGCKMMDNWKNKKGKSRDIENLKSIKWNWEKI